MLTVKLCQRVLWMAAVVSWVSGGAGAALADDTQAQADPVLEITIEGGTEARTQAYSVPLQQAPVTTPETGALLRRAPGANLNSNGPLTGIAQYRGMYGESRQRAD